MLATSKDRPLGGGGVLYYLNADGWCELLHRRVGDDAGIRDLFQQCSSDQLDGLYGTAACADGFYQMTVDDLTIAGSCVDLAKTNALTQMKVVKFMKHHAKLGGESGDKDFANWSPQTVATVRKFPREGRRPPPFPTGEELPSPPTLNGCQAVDGNVLNNKDAVQKITELVDAVSTEVLDTLSDGDYTTVGGRLCVIAHVDLAMLTNLNILGAFECAFGVLFACGDIAAAAAGEQALQLSNILGVEYYPVGVPGCRYIGARSDLPQRKAKDVTCPGGISACSEYLSYGQFGIGANGVQKFEQVLKVDGRVCGVQIFPELRTQGTINGGATVTQPAAGQFTYADQLVNSGATEMLSPDVQQEDVDGVIIGRSVSDSKVRAFGLAVFKCESSDIALADIRELRCNGGHPEELRRACLDVIKRLAGVTTAPTAWATHKHSNDVLEFCEETGMLPSMLDHAAKADSGKVPLARFPWTGLQKVPWSSNRCTQTPPLCLSSVCVTRVSWK